MYNSVDIVIVQMKCTITWILLKRREFRNFFEIRKTKNLCSRAVLFKLCAAAHECDARIVWCAVGNYPIWIFHTVLNRMKNYISDFSEIGMAVFMLTRMKNQFSDFLVFEI